MDETIFMYPEDKNLGINFNDVIDVSFHRFPEVRHR